MSGPYLCPKCNEIVSSSDIEEETEKVKVYHKSHSKKTVKVHEGCGTKLQIIETKRQ